MVTMIITMIITIIVKTIGLLNISTNDLPGTLEAETDW